MNKIKENLIDLCFLLTIPALGSLYPILNNSTKGAQSLVTEVDRIIPFIKEFIVPYVLWYPFIVLCMIYFCVKDKKTYFRTLISINVGMTVSYFIFLIFQTHVPRPILNGNDIFTKLIAIIYIEDKPYNCFPSLHVFESYLMIRGIYACSGRSRIVTAIINLTAILIIFSTMFIKQHVILDVLGGIYLGEIIFNLVPNYRNMLFFAKKRKLNYTIDR